MREIRCDGCGTHFPADAPTMNEVRLQVPVKRIGGETESEFRARGIHNADLCDHCVDEVLRGYFGHAVPLHLPEWVDKSAVTPESLRGVR